MCLERTVRGWLRAGGITGAPARTMPWLERPLTVCACRGACVRSRSSGITLRNCVYARYSTSLASRHSELAILACARRWMAQCEWWVHAPLALRAGVPAGVLEAIRIGAQPSFDEPADATVWD